MKRSVLLTARAERDLGEAYAYISRGSPANALRWLDEMEAGIGSLAAFAERCALAPEGGAFGVEIRQLVRAGYRALFIVRGRSVIVLHVRHASRRQAGASDLAE